MVHEEKFVEETAHRTHQYTANNCQLGNVSSIAI